MRGVKLKGELNLYRSTEEYTVKEGKEIESMIYGQSKLHHFQLKAKPVHALVLLDLNLHTNAKHMLLKTKDRTTV